MTSVSQGYDTEYTGRLNAEAERDRLRAALLEENETLQQVDDERLRYKAALERIASERRYDDRSWPAFAHGLRAFARTALEGPEARA